MLSLEPSGRLSFADYLVQNRGTAFPDIFYTFLHPFISSLDKVPASIPSVTPAVTRNISTGSGVPTPSAEGGGGLGPQPQGPILLRTDADEKIERVWTEWEMVTRYLDESIAPSATTPRGRPAAPAPAAPVTAGAESEHPDRYDLRSSEVGLSTDGCDPPVQPPD